MESIEPRIARLTLTVRNDGAVPAEALILEYEVLGDSGALLILNGALHKPLPALQLSPPPKPPRVRYIDPAAHFQTIEIYPHRFDVPSIDGLRGARDPYTFYTRQEQEKPTSTQEFECDEFRHETTQTRSIGILFPRTLVSKGALVVRATARNMSKRVELSVALEHSAEESDPTDSLKRAITSIRDYPKVIELASVPH